MLRSPAMFLPIALVGFGGIAGAAAGAAKFLFFLFMVRGLIFFVLRTWQGEESHNSGGGRLLKQSDHFIQQPKHDRSPLA
jgi:uncharacterized membrane protein YtjA (UPF0391 family)